MTEGGQSASRNTGTNTTVLSQRVDKWLWFARFFKSRSLASRLCKGHKLRINRRIIDKSSATTKVGDILTFPQGNGIRTVRVLDPGVRRGPASEAQLLYEDLTPPPPVRDESDQKPAPTGRPRGAGRPTKSDRRALDRLTRGE
jgi:ribosome-associated heat shock protein Hsp15